MAQDVFDWTLRLIAATLNLRVSRLSLEAGKEFEFLQI